MKREKKWNRTWSHGPKPRNGKDQDILANIYFTRTTAIYSQKLNTPNPFYRLSRISLHCMIWSWFIQNSSFKKKYLNISSLPVTHMDAYKKNQQLVN